MQIVILLSALLASLTGLVTGDRPIARAQLEVSLRAQAETPASPAHARNAAVVRLASPVNMRDTKAQSVDKPAPAPRPRDYLRLKRALLE